MKKTNLLLASLLLATPLAGCSDASANLKDGSTVLFKIGSSKVTKQDLFSLMNSTAGASTVISNATKTICEKEIEITDEMKEDAQTTLDSYKSMYGDTFNSYLEQNNMSEEDYLNKNLIPSLQAEKLTEAYIEAEWEKVTDLYEPVMATVLDFSDQDKAQAALSALKDGSKSAEEVSMENECSHDGTSKLYTINDTDLDSTVMSVITNGTPDDGWSLVPTTSGDKVYLIRVDDNNPENYRDKVFSTLSGTSNVSADATTYYFRKYGFHIYDITVYNAIKSDYPDYLVQNIKDTDQAE